MSVILIVADGLQVAAMGAYGNDWLPTPHLDRLAAESVVFDQHFADVPAADALCAAATNWVRPLDATPDALELALSRLTPPSDAILGIEFSLYPPWEWVADDEDADAEDESPEPWPDPPTGWLDPDDDRAFDRLQQTYAAVVRSFDDHIGDVLAAFQECGLLDSALVILTAGRGQNLGEHGMIGDFRPWLHEELVHLPLMIRLPGGEQAGRRVAHLTQTVDIPATIFDALGVARPDDGHGHSLLPLCRGAGAVRPYACTGLQIGDAVEYSLQSGEEKLILPTSVPDNDPPRGPMYFVKPDDRWEVNDMRVRFLDRTDALERTLRAYLVAAARPGRLDVPPLPTENDEESV